MTDRTPKQLFTPSYIRRIIQERDRNMKTEFPDYIYRHPAASETVVKTIDLSLTTPLCGINSKPTRNQNWQERWVEAYLINKAKKNNWELSLAGKECSFLASQFTFRENDDLKIDGTQHRHVDLMFYDKENKHLVVLELKSNANPSSLYEAKQELTIYRKELCRLLKAEKTKDGKNAFCEAFGLGTVKNVIGYIVYPRTEKESPIKEKDFDKYEPFGLMEYIKPWNKFDEVEKSGRNMTINLTCSKPVD